MWLEKSLGRETSAPARRVRTRATVKAQRMRRRFMDISGGYLYNSASIRRAWIGWRMQRKSPERVRAFCSGEVGVSYSVQHLKTREPLVPPKPKEFESA